MTNVINGARFGDFARLLALVALGWLMFAPAAMAQQLCLCLRCLSGNVLSYVMPAGDMKPTFETGQCLEVDLWDDTAPRLGQIIVFPHPDTGAQFIKRIAALPGQQIQMIGGRIFLDGREVPSDRRADYEQLYSREGPLSVLPRCPASGVAEGETCLIPRREERLGQIAYDVLDLGPSRFDDTPVFTVPEGHVFVLGDHRDNSIDSRTPQSAGGVGFVPIDSIIGWVNTNR